MYIIIQKKQNAFYKWSVSYLEMFSTLEEAQIKLEELINNANNQYGKDYMKKEDYEIIKIKGGY